ncbi:Pentatricopeptide repeat-containing protein [Nymphaea thermarum]|nr:Pentatricopeptide repeat-containing protein [Nymphaea thermarum]
MSMNDEHPDQYDTRFTTLYATLTSTKQGEVKEAFSLYEEMVKNGILPDIIITYSSLTNGLCKSGKVTEAKCSP